MPYNVIVATSLLSGNGDIHVLMSVCLTTPLVLIGACKYVCKLPKIASLALGTDLSEIVIYKSYR